MTFIFLVAYHFLFATYSNLAYVTFIFYLYSFFFYSPCWRFVLQTETLGKYNHIMHHFIFVFFFHLLACCRKEQFTVLSFKIWKKKKTRGDDQKGKEILPWYLLPGWLFVPNYGAWRLRRLLKRLHGGTLGTSAIISQNAPKLSLSSPLFSPVQNSRNISLFCKQKKQDVYKRRWSSKTSEYL